MSITDHIQYLICRHDCVVVPGLGAFVAQYFPARISPDGAMILPPSRSVVFNGAISHDDGLLVGSVARRSETSYEDARERVLQDVEMLKRRIEAEGAVVLPRIGRLQRENASAFSFVPDAENPVSDMAFSSLLPIELEQAVEKEDTPRPVMLEVGTVSRRSRWRSVGKYAAAVAVLLAIGATLSTPVIVNRNIDKASISIPKVTSVKTVELPAKAAAASADVSPVLYVSVSEADTTPGVGRATMPSVLMIDEIKDEIDPAYDCYVIVGSCASMKEAERFVAARGGKGALRILPSDGRYRIYAAVANDFDAAYTFKSSAAFARTYPSAWVYSGK